MRLQILKFAITETGTSDDMIGANFMTNIQSSHLRAFEEQTQGYRLIKAENLAGLAGSIIQQDIGHARHLQIVNGWGTQRYRFVMILGYPESSIASTAKYIYTGYTSHAGYSSVYKDFDPNMQLFFNNAIMVNQTFRQTPYGQEPVVNVSDISHVLTPNSVGGGMHFITNPQTMEFVNTPSTIRPSDIFSHLTSEAIQREMHGVNSVVSANTMLDAKKASRINALPSKYLEASVGALYNATQTIDPTLTETDLYSAAAGYVKDTFLHTDPLIGQLAETGYAINGFTEWRTIKGLFPYIDQVTTFSVRPPQAQEIQTQTGDKYMLRRGENETLVNQHNQVNTTANALIATTLMQSVPGVLLTNLIGRCVIRATNMILGQTGIHIEIGTPFAITDLPMGYLMNRIPFLETQLKALIFTDLPININIPFFIEMHVDVFGESFIRVDYNGSGPIPFGIPSYCDAMMSPLLAPTQKPLEQISHDIRFLTGESSHDAGY